MLIPSEMKYFQWHRLPLPKNLRYYVNYLLHIGSQNRLSDNGPHVISEDFHQFITRHICCAPYHPASNGLVECFVHTFKEALDTQSRTLLARQPVMVKNMHPGENQIPGLVLGQLGPVSFLVDEASHRSSQNL